MDSCYYILYCITNNNLSVIQLLTSYDVFININAIEKCPIPLTHFKVQITTIIHYRILNAALFLALLSLLLLGIIIIIANNLNNDWA